MKNIDESNSKSERVANTSDLSGLRTFVISSVVLLLAGCGSAQQQNTDTAPKLKDPSAEPDNQPKENQSIVSDQQSAPEAAPQTVKEEGVQKEVVISPPPPELSDFVKRTLEELKGKRCKEGERDIKPEIRGIIKGDNIEALAVSYGGAKWEFSFNPSIKSKESGKMFGITFNDKYLDGLISTGVFEFNDGVIENNDGAAWLLGEMKSLPSFKDPKILWSADEESPGLTDTSDCAQ
jgi:hypothetical protein